MANRNQDYYSGSRRSQQNWRDEDEDRGRYGSERGGNEADAGSRGGNYDQGRVQYRRQSADYSGYGDFGRGDYGGERSGWSDQGRYGQSSGYGQGDYGESRFGQGVYGQNNYRAGGYGDREENQRGQSNYGQSRQWRGYGGSSGGAGYSGGGYGYGGESSGRGGYAQGGYGQGGESGYGGGRTFNEPYGEGQQYGQGGEYGGQSSGQGWGGPQGYGGSQGQGQSMGQHRGKGPKGYQRSDDRIKEMISERLRDDPQIDPSEVTVTVQGGKVTLEGTVDSRQVKNAIEEIAEQYGNDVQNNLRVQRAGQSNETQGRQQGKTTGSGAGTEDLSKQKQH